ncbi:MAG TPA: hypothetical protein VGG75_02310 [Trebonia sp.]|jgi:hypothetical protein
MTTPVAPGVLAKAHEVWLNETVDNLAKIENPILRRELEGQWWLPENFRKWSTQFAPHYNDFDRPLGQQLIWRFTSRPVTESIEVKSGTSIQEIIEVIGKHSGGNDKSNMNVRTSSFARNLGAFIGTACSGGGDKGVLTIVVRAEYLCGISIGTLANYGISGHPALARPISAFETEYVLVPTPGNDSVPISALATVVYENPFKNLFGPDGVVKGYNITLPIGNRENFVDFLDRADNPPKGAPPVVVEKTELKGKLSDVGGSGLIAAILDCAVKASGAASKQSGTVQDKEVDAKDITIIQAAMKQYYPFLPPRVRD